ncbi:MAG: hypothetical protein DLM65_02530 [Candidatus Aeolococcus gillhamiae]|uniref:Uncharacterized protein n=1 Tax=Candidatus Aeolococcus gillhamiae TaxID=3127015 RepID=A0A2W5ZGX1_9BACT|nr:MAG: hypothetical protein DLM65_02530 [Candidatus Dormibacter sp. RRmetagenome_bin12]
MALAAMLVLVACGTSKSTTDATVAECNADPGGGKPTAKGQVVNTSSKSSSFFLRIGFYDSSANKVSEGVDQVGSVDPGKGSPWQTTGATGAKGPLTCKVITLRRTVSVGG